MNEEKNRRDIKIHACNGHISGLLGEAILKFFLKEKLIEQDENAYNITDKGWESLELVGIDINYLSSNKNRKIVDICTENRDGILFEHIGSRLGFLIKEKLLDLKWIKNYHENLFLTNKGVNGLDSLGIKIKRTYVNLLS